MVFDMDSKIGTDAVIEISLKELDIQVRKDVVHVLCLLDVSGKSSN